MLLLYSTPITRYAVHGMITRTFALSSDELSRDEEKGNNLLAENETYVSPKAFKTDAFIGKQLKISSATEGELVYDATSNNLIGTISASAEKSFDLMLYSDPMYKGNFFVQGEKTDDADECGHFFCKSLILDKANPASYLCHSK